jgi:hypothetical protein
MEYLKTHARDFPQVRLALVQLAVAMEIDCFDAMAPLANGVVAGADVATAV